MSPSALAEECVDRMADDVCCGRPIEPFVSNVISHVRKRRARGIKHDSDEDCVDSAKVPHEFLYSSQEEDDKSDESDKADYETPPRKKRRHD